MAFSFDVKSDDEPVVASQGKFVIYFNSGYDQVDALFMKPGEAYTPGYQEFVPGVFKIVLIVGIVYNTLYVTFIIPYGQFNAEGVIFSVHEQKERSILASGRIAFSGGHETYEYCEVYNTSEYTGRKCN